MRYKTFVIRSFNLLLIVGMLLGYQSVLKIRKQQEEINYLNYQVAEMEMNASVPMVKEGTNTVAASYKDGNYTGTAEGFGGPITVQVTVKDGALNSIAIMDAAGEDSAYLQMAQGIITTMIEEQSVEVDTISGATFSSTGIKEGVKAALESAAVDE